MTPTKTLTPKQTEILILLYRFRFLNRRHFQKFLHHKDPRRINAKAKKIKKDLGWQPKYSDLKTIIKTAWQWHKNHPDGFKSVKVES